MGKLDIKVMTMNYKRTPFINAHFESVCLCVGMCANAYSLPVIWKESSVGIILVTVVSSKNSEAVSDQPVLQDESIRLRWRIPVQFHRRCVSYQVSRPWPHA